MSAQKKISANPPEISMIDFLCKMAHRCASFRPQRRDEDINLLDEEELTQLDANPTDQAEGKATLVLFLILFFTMSIIVI